MKKILSLAITLMMVLSIASIPAMAATLPTGAYASGIASSLTSEYEYADFTADFAAAEYTAFEDFEEVLSGYTAVTDYQGNTTGHYTIYPYEMAVSGVENGSFSLKLNNTTSNKLLNVFQKGNTNIGDLSSGSYAVLAGYNNSTNANIVFETGDPDTEGNVYNVMKVNDEVQADYKISAIGFVHKYGSSREEMKLVVTYDDNSTETVETAEPGSGTRTASYFCGVKAPAGKYITALTIQPLENSVSFIVDDLALIFDKVVDVTAVEISGADTIAEPQFNASVTAQLSAKALDADNNAIDGAAVTYSVEGNGATIDENGLLTLKRTGDTSLAGNVTVTATAGNVSADKTITITATPAYYAAVGDYNATEYTKAAFVSDLAAAQYKTVINFADGAHNSNIGDYEKNFGASLTNNGGAVTVTATSYSYNLSNLENNRINFTGNASTLGAMRFEKQFKQDDTVTSGNGYHNIALSYADVETIKPTAFGMALGNNAKDLNTKFRIYLDGATTPIEYIGKLDYDEVTLTSPVGFYGYKAPVGRYIDHIELETLDCASYVDDIAFIFSEPGEVPAITLSTDAAAGKIISKTADVTGDVYVNIAENAFSGKKVLLALYGGEELLDVAIADDGETQAMAVLPEGKTLTKIKTFVWDFAGGLIPVQGTIEINQ